MTAPYNGAAPNQAVFESSVYHVIEKRGRENAEGELARRRRVPRRPFAELILDAAGLARLPDPVPLVGSWLFADSLAWISGPPESAKSFVALDIACCTGTGKPWHGFPVRRGPVLYV